MLTRRLSNRPTALELKLRNILRSELVFVQWLILAESDDMAESPELERSLDFESRKIELKSSMKKRADRSTPNLLTGTLFRPDLIQS
jgi:RPEL repeat